MGIKAIIWDIGGVLIEDPKIGNFWKNVKGAKELRDLFGSGKISKKKFIEEGAKPLKIKKSEFLKNYEKIYFSIKPLKKVVQIYQSIKIKTYILSDTNMIHLNYIKENFPDILKKTERSFFSPEIGRRKDDVVTFEFILKELKINPEEALFIDNQEGHIKRAKSLGINTIHHQDVSQLKKDLEKLKIK